MRSNPRRSDLRLLAAGALVSAAVTSVLAQQPPVRPTFKAGVDLVPVDVSVIDKSGRPIPDLKAGDFTVAVDGRPRTVVSAQFVSIPQASPATASSSTPAHYSSNAGVAGGRLIVIAVDAGNIGTARGKTTLDAASRFVARLNPADRVALVTLPGGSPQVDFTANHALIQSLLPRIVGQISPNAASKGIGLAEALAFERSDDNVTAQIIDQLCSAEKAPTGREACAQDVTNEANMLVSDTRGRTSQTLAALRRLFDRLGASETPKTVLLLSEGLLLDRDFSDASWIGARAAANHITLHVLQIATPDPNGNGGGRASTTVTQDREVMRDGLDAMTGMARGEVLRIVSSPDSTFQRLALELSGYYLLGFEPQPGDRDAKPHKIRVDVRRRDVDVHARREFSVEPSSTRSSEELLLDTLRSPLLVSDIGLKLTTYAFKDPNSPRVRVILAADVDRSANPDGQFALAYVLADDKGKVVANQLEKTLTTPIRPDTRAQTYVGAALAAAGQYTLKLAVVDDAGRRGSIERSVAAKLSAFGRVQATDLLIADNSVPGSSGLTPAVDASFVGDEVHGYLELYGESPEALRGAAATIEVAENESARPLAGAPATLDTTGLRAVVQASVPIGLLPAGSYVLRAVISDTGGQVGQVIRPFQIARPAKTLSDATRPAGAARPAAPVVTGARIGAFDRSAVLSPQVLGFFLDHLASASPSATAVSPAVADVRAGRFAEAMRALDTAKDDLLAVPFLKGLVLLSRGELNPAANKFREALRIDSEFLPAAFYLGACYAAGGKDREAASAWQTSLVTESGAPFVYTLLGDALLRLRDIDQAVVVLTEARGLYPDDDQIATRLATALIMASRGTDALPLLDAYLSRHPTDQDQLVAALRILYEAHAAGRSIGAPAEDRSRFDRYADAYAAIKGPQLPLVEQWRKAMKKPD